MRGNDSRPTRALWCSEDRSTTIIPLSDSEVRVVFDFKDDAQDERRTYAHERTACAVCVLC